MSGIAIVCVCWLYAFAWNGEHHNPSHFSSCAFGVCLCVPVCLAYKMGSADVAFRTPLAPYEKSKSLGSGGSMVARLKLKGIDGRAPPGVEPAA
ncbi:hypothetical protein KIW84_UN0289 [Lathyrus oleraceus]|nr:hypothetical protein KIW84_UN0797 [Pisum sativum]KAI5381366.1 hypothetical protein KIW84_UN0787 [Pisum sativum]KAI5381420.1 hypothetical protein KIW84_UN0737 [Pisum sativum]KAI5381958.1 hypothetical protein KIW84_UN0289 [Pisum sativum]